MSSLKTILVVDDSAINSAILSKILSEKYTVLTAENGAIALELLAEPAHEIAAVMLDLNMPVMDGYSVLESIQNDERYSNLPVLVTTDSNNNESEIKALTLGAWDFVTKPYNPQIIMFRLKNAIDRSQLSALNQLRYLAEYDVLTGIFNKTKFFEETRKAIDSCRDKTFAFLRFDVDRFQLVNSFFGTAEGDKLLVYIAKHLKREAEIFEKASYGRIESDVFCLCMPYEKSKVENIIHHSKKVLAKYNPNYDVVPSIGIYIIEDTTISVEEMYNRATLAAKKCKGNYVEYYAYYNKNMSMALALEQEITNDMNIALESGQFEIYMQPKYNIHTNMPCGAEALVRWNHPEKGMLLPGEFIPVFERNGFITKLDYYVWEQTCKCLHEWRLREVFTHYPVSVNVSRVNLYNPQLVDTLLELVDRYQLEPALLNLELTESAYTDNPTAMKNVTNRLQSHGFVIMMDDFGSGYSSLSLLKDISVDILKIDMRFLIDSGVSGRGENIIASVIRMAKWLNIPVIAEGAETAEQVNFLRSVGCDYAQGYYYARPMPISEYEQLCVSNSLDGKLVAGEDQSSYFGNDMFSLNQEMKLLFSNALQPAVIYEFRDDQIEIIRVNEAYYVLLGHDDMLMKSADMLSFVEEGYRDTLLNTFRACVQMHVAAECEYMRRGKSGMPIWIHAKLSYASMVGDKNIIIGELTDITMRKELDSELQKYRETLLSVGNNSHTVLIVDDADSNRTALKKILQSEFAFYEAKNGEEAISILRDKQNQIDLILLDISTPAMGGTEFLKYKSNIPSLDGIPVITITSDESPAQQISSFALGANDYIIKPFIPEVVVRRVSNVLEANHRYKEMVKEYNTMSAQIKTDLMTGLINRVSVEEMISRYLNRTSKTCAMLMIDIDNFKKINDSNGHNYGDKVICAVAKKLSSFFRKEDIVARMGGDELAVFVGDISNIEVLESKAHRVCESMSGMMIDGEHADITCSIGIAISSDQAQTFEALYKNADKALYSAKCNGRNKVSIYVEKQFDTSIAK
ncbi:MAG: EAL domain-containing protein [Oscillospiraceae bacterium]